MLRSPLFIVVVLLVSGRACGQEALQPAPMTDPLRALRGEQLEAWESLYRALRDSKQPRSLTSAWALFHQFDVDYFTLLDGDSAPVLDRYEREIEAFRKSIAERADEDEVTRLAVMELDALRDDLEANRLQNARPDDKAEAAQLKVWNDKFNQFQLARAKNLQDRGKLVLNLYRTGDVDAIRLCVVLLERQIAERVLVEHQEMIAGAKNAAQYAARRQRLFEKQRKEWKQLADLLPDSKAATSTEKLGNQICELHLLTLDLLESRLHSPEDTTPAKEAEEASAALAKKLFAAYQELQRSAVAQHGDAKLSVEQLARIHDLRMYTTIWSDPSVPAADIVADAIEVATMWQRLHDALTKDEPEALDTQIALAKKLDTEVAQRERQGTADPERGASAP